MNWHCCRFWWLSALEHVYTYLWCVQWDCCLCILVKCGTYNTSEMARCKKCHGYFQISKEFLQCDSPPYCTMNNIACTTITALSTLSCYSHPHLPLLWARHITRYTDTAHTCTNLLCRFVPAINVHIAALWVSCVRGVVWCAGFEVGTD